VQDPALALIELHQVPLRSTLQAVQVSLVCTPLHPVLYGQQTC